MRIAWFGRPQAFPGAPLVVLGYFVLHRSETLREAFSKTFAARPCIWSNSGFMASLIALEEEMTRKPSTMSAAEYEVWGDYDGLEDEGTQQLPNGLPRFVRDETCLEEEMRQLAILEATANSTRSKPSHIEPHSHPPNPSCRPFLLRHSHMVSNSLPSGCSAACVAGFTVSHNGSPGR